MDSRRVRVVSLFFFLPLPTKHSGKKCPLIAFGFSSFRKSGLVDFFFLGKIPSPSLHQVLRATFRLLYSQKARDHPDVARRQVHRYVVTYEDSVSPSLLGQVPWQQNYWLPKQLQSTECTRFLRDFCLLFVFCCCCCSALHLLAVNRLCYYFDCRKCSEMFRITVDIFGECVSARASGK